MEREGKKPLSEWCGCTATNTLTFKFYRSMKDNQRLFHWLLVISSAIGYFKVEGLIRAKGTVLNPILLGKVIKTQF